MPTRSEGSRAMVPSYSASYPPSSRSSEDLPTPLAPSTPTLAPSSSRSDTSSSSTRDPTDFVTPSSVTTACDAPPPPPPPLPPPLPPLPPDLPPPPRLPPRFASVRTNGAAGVRTPTPPAAARATEVRRGLSMIFDRRHLQRSCCNIFTRPFPRSSLIERAHSHRAQRPSRRGVPKLVATVATCFPPRTRWSPTPPRPRPSSSA